MINLIWGLGCIFHVCLNQILVVGVIFMLDLDLDLPNLHQDAKDVGSVWFAVKGHHAAA